MMFQRVLLLGLVSAWVVSVDDKSFDPDSALSQSVLPYEWIGEFDNTELKEPSGICWHIQRGVLFVVGDRGDLCELTDDGEAVRQQHLSNADFEGITHDPRTGLLYIVVEGEEVVLEVDPENFEVIREFVLPRSLNGSTVLKKGGHGIEGITFVSDPSHPHGGIFWIANQVDTLVDKNDLSAVFQVELPLQSETEQPKLLSCFSPGVTDLSGLHYDAATGHVWILSDQANLLLKYTTTFDFLDAFALPGNNQEGVTVDELGHLYIAQDSGGIIKLKWLHMEVDEPRRK